MGIHPEPNLKECGDCEFMTTTSWELADHLSRTGHKKATTLRKFFREHICLVRTGHILHKGKWEYESEGSCDQSRTCQRCGSRRTRTRHHKEEREYWSQNSCDLVHTCRRCGNRRAPTDFQRQTKHEFRGEICERCGVSRPLPPHL